jgi:hypothetical protein
MNFYILPKLLFLVILHQFILTHVALNVKVNILFMQKVLNLRNNKLDVWHVHFFLVLKLISY